MTEMTDAEVEAVDFAVVAFRDGADPGNGWELAELPGRALDGVDAIVEELRRYPGDGALALISVDEDFAVVIRVTAGAARLLLSDAGAAVEWTLARSVVDHLGATVDVDDDDPPPVGDLDLLADLGFPAAALGDLLADDPYPDELLGEIAHRAGFGEEFDEFVEAAD